MDFKELSLSNEVLQGIETLGYETPSPIQEESIPVLLKGRDVIGQAQTGTGKTAAFGIPVLENTTGEGVVQSLILCPTRELCIQVTEEISALGQCKKNLTILPVYGGTSIERQIRSLNRGVQIVVGTPGRVMDLIRRKKLILDEISMVVLDEADEMFDMGFRDDMDFILSKTPDTRQTCFFSATMGEEIQDFSKKYQRDPVTITIKRKQLTVENITQYYLEMRSSMKTEILSRLIDLYNPELAVVFCNTKRKVDQVVQELTTRGFRVDGLHGDLKQNQRDHVMRRFREGTIDILVATDVAARGIDVDNVDIVVNYDLPQDEEFYVHRIGRTARAGRKGTAFTFVVGRDIYKLEDIQKYTKAELKYLELPTLDTLRDKAEERLLGKVEAELNRDHDLSKYRAMIDRLLLNEYPITDIAAILIKMLEKEEKTGSYQRLKEVDYGKKFRPHERRKKSNRKKKGTQKEIVPKGPRLHLNRGRKDGINPKVILAALHQETKVPRSAVGNININQRETYIELPNKLIENAARDLNGKKIAGKKVKAQKRVGK